MVSREEGDLFQGIIRPYSVLITSKSNEVAKEATVKLDVCESADSAFQLPA